MSNEIWIIVCIPVILTLLQIYRNYFPPIPPRKKKYPYALLLGCPNHNDGTYATSQIKRCELAIEAYQKGMYDMLIIAGGAVKNEYVESEEMNRYIQKKMTIPVLIENRSRNTWENFEFSRKLIKDQPVLILSSGTHIRRACAIARNFFQDYGAYWYPDHKLKHIFREITSRILYIWIEIKKKSN